MSIAKRLEDQSCTNASLDLAIEGRELPQALGHPVTQACIVRGIRSTPGFAQELYGHAPIFTRALHARAIMSGQVPLMREPYEYPYCIWFPCLAEEKTYRDLVERYPDMRYQVGRACAAAGYTDLFGELNLLPDVHIADEARDSGAQDIYDHIIAQGTTYAIMNDYTRSVNTANPEPRDCSADTMVLSWLRELRQDPHDAARQNDLATWSRTFLGEGCHYNITEDFGFEVQDRLEISCQAMQKAQRLALSFLYMPLPRHLPLLAKDVLILMAAYEGDIDRYVRLRRPYMINKEYQCNVRGIYHSTVFAKWWSITLERDRTTRNLDAHRTTLQRAIYARQIMDGDLSRITAELDPYDLPYCIYYPKIPSAYTIYRLSQIRPDMKQQLARVCIIANRDSLYDDLDPDYDHALFVEAQSSPNPHFLQHMEKKRAAQEASDEPNQGQATYTESWKFRFHAGIEYEPSGTDLYADISPYNILTEFTGPYDGLSADASSVELRVSTIDQRQEIDGNSLIRTSWGKEIDRDLKQGLTVDLGAL